MKRLKRSYNLYENCFEMYQYINLKEYVKIFLFPKAKKKKKKKRNQLQFSKREPNAMELREYEIPGIAQSMVLSALILLLAKNSKKLSN